MRPEHRTAQLTPKKRGSGRKRVHALSLNCNYSIGRWLNFGRTQVHKNMSTWGNLTYRCLWTAWNTAALTGNTSRRLKTKSWGSVGIVPTLRHPFVSILLSSSLSPTTLSVMSQYDYYQYDQSTAGCGFSREELRPVQCKPCTDRQESKKKFQSETTPRTYFL
jgi:hypothetical protein